MKKLFLVFIFIPIVLSAAIDERKTDMYFVNGILTEKKDAIDNADLLEKSIKKNLYANNEEEMYRHIGKVTYAYNHTIDFLSDGIETFIQKFGWFALRDALGDVHGTDLHTQIEAYKQSIKDGHRVLAVAHSQGNLFTYEAYNSLDDWMKTYFEAVSIASPMSADIKYGTTRIDWDNDIVPRIATVGESLPWMTQNSVRNVSWESNNVFGTGQPDSDYVTSSELGKTYSGGGYAYTVKRSNKSHHLK